jgi:hypothetical protein
MKRQIDILKLTGVTKSTSEPAGEFVLHIKDDYDYRIKSDIRDEVIEYLKKIFLILQKRNLPVYGVVICTLLLPSLETEDFG